MTDPAGTDRMQPPLEQRLGYRFRQPALLDEALRHRSFVHEHPGVSDNERLEFLGDAVLNLIVTQHLLERYPRLAEGQLSRLRSQLVSTRHLAHAARGLDLGADLKLGRGEVLSGGPEKESVLADAVEAVLAAVYRDGGLKAARGLVRRHIIGRHAQAAPEVAPWSDPRSRLQELVQAGGAAMPEYRLLDQHGPDHAKEFRVQVRVGAHTALGSGTSKKRAAEEAARHMLERLSADPPPP
jgi:ribonuclease III